MLSALGLCLQVELTWGPGAALGLCVGLHHYGARGKQGDIRGQQLCGVLQAKVFRWGEVAGTLRLEVCKEAVSKQKQSSSALSLSKKNPVPYEPLSLFLRV